MTSAYGGRANESFEGGVFMVGTWRVRIGVVAVAAGALLGAAAVPASAWPLPLTSEDNNYLGAMRGNFPGDDDQLLIAGKQACQRLYSGQGRQAVIDGLAAEYGASPGAAGTLVSAARSTYCTQAPG
jgi:hypothetical protein